MRSESCKPSKPNGCIELRDMDSSSQPAGRHSRNAGPSLQTPRGTNILSMAQLNQFKEAQKHTSKELIPPIQFPEKLRLYSLKEKRTVEMKNKIMNLQSTGEVLIIDCEEETINEPGGITDTILGQAHFSAMYTQQ